MASFSDVMKSIFGNTQESAANAGKTVTDLVKSMRNADADYAAQQEAIASSPTDYGNEEPEKTAYSTEPKTEKSSNDPSSKDYKAWKDGIFYFAPIEYMTNNPNGLTYDQWVYDQYVNDQALPLFDAAEYTAVPKTLEAISNRRAEKRAEASSDDYFMPMEYMLQNPEGLTYEDWLKKNVDSLPYPSISPLEAQAIWGDVLAQEREDMRNGNAAGNQENKKNAETSANLSNNSLAGQNNSMVSQIAEYYNWLDSDSPEAQWFKENYSDLADKDQGYARLRASNNRDAWGYLLGLNGNEGIGNWRNRYTASGVDFSDEDAALDNLMGYLYGEGALNPYEYMYNQKGSAGASTRSRQQTLDWLRSMYDFGPDAQALVGSNLDENDARYLMLLHDLSMNNGWGDLDIDFVNDLAHAAGEQGTFKLGYEDDEDYKKAQNQGERKNSRQYSVEDLALLGSEYSNLVPYLPSGLADERMVDTVIQGYNDAHKNGPKLYLSF